MADPTRGAPPYAEKTLGPSHLTKMLVRWGRLGFGPQISLVPDTVCENKLCYT